MRKTILIMALCLALTGCWDLFGKKPETEPRYNAKIAWDSGLFSNQYATHTVDGDSVFFYERPPGYTTVNVYALTRLSAETGDFVWRSSLIFHNVVQSQMVVIGDYVYVFVQDNTILAFGRETGEHTATATVIIEGERWESLEMEWNPAAYQHYIYQGFWGRLANYFVQLDIHAIDQSGDPDEVQQIAPKVLWVLENDRHINGNPVVHNNTVYTITLTPLAENPVELAGFDIATGEMVLYKTFGGSEDKENDCIPFPDEGALISLKTLFIHDNFLYHLGTSIVCWDLTTGNQLYRHVFTDDLPNPKRYPGRTLQAVFSNGKIYYTSNSSYSSLGYRNIHCIDQTTGKLVWNTVTRDSESLHTNPILAHKRLYVPQYQGLFVYEPETGNLIGVDRSFRGAGFLGRNILYNDYMICVQIDDSDTGGGRMVAVYVGK
ncbi:MAG: PQQ-like beta-propeller repeat protein [Treponema sp.]|jgi:outer membrane protein assembly factor BamB|nr:PQQ-like beta-propeller repeat protein [Treponema sp.]